MATYFPGPFLYLKAVTEPVLQLCVKGVEAGQKAKEKHLNESCPDTWALATLSCSSQGTSQPAPPARCPGLLNLRGVSKHRGTRGFAAQHPNSKRLCQQVEVLLQW